MKAIAFDWGGVLNGKPSRYFDQAVADIFGVSAAEFQRAYFLHNKKVNKGELSWLELWAVVAAELGRPDEPELLRNIAEISRKINAGDALNQDVILLAERLKSNGYKIAILSNNSVDKANLMRSHGFDNRFDVLHVSAETGLVKPDPNAFLHLCQDLGIEPRDLIFIDDTPMSLSTANEVGYQPLLFDSYDQLLADLQGLGIHTA